MNDNTLSPQTGQPVSPEIAPDQRIPLEIAEHIPRIDYTNRIINALVESTDNPALPTRIYQREGFPVRITGIQEDGICDPKLLKPRIEILTPEALQYEISKSLSIQVSQKETCPREENPPISIIKNVLAASWFPFKEIAGLLKHPTVNSKGDIITGPGVYDEASRLFIAATSGLSLDAAGIPEHPDKTQIAAARECLMGILEGFPFVSDSDRANALALFFTVLCRPLINGLVPAFLIQAPTAGTGKTLLANTLLTAAMGAKPEASTLPDNEAELSKMMLSLLMEGSECIFFDNIEGRLKSATLCGIITSGLYQGRLLGVNKMVKTPVIAPIVFTGNNPNVSGDMPRRIVPIRLDAAMEDPTVRDGFLYPDLEEHLAVHRSRYICAGLTLVRAWVDQGRVAGTYKMASFNTWAKVIGGILDTAGVSGFLGNLKEFRESADTEKAAWQAFVQKWHETYREEPVLAKDLYQTAIDTEVISEKTTANGFARYLGQKRDQIIAGFKVANKLQGTNRSRAWYLTPVKS